MKWTASLKQVLKDPLMSFKLLQAVIAAICMLIPVFLKKCDQDAFYPKLLTSAGLNTPARSVVAFAIDSVTPIYDNRAGFQLYVTDSILRIQIGTAARVPKDRYGFRLSMSDYVYSSRSYLFGVLYCMAAMLFIFNGVVYIKRRNILQVRNNGHWYNIWIGIFLLGVSLCPDQDNKLWHILFSILFFAGNIMVLLFIANPGETRKSKIVRFAMAAVVVLVLILWKFDFLTLLGAEWFSLIVIATHLILVTLSVDYYSVDSRESFGRLSPDLLT
jgi:hypothetical protein